ncbi:hypothetical protein T484DRAFT_1620675 [Baffinella frigidus]|nr:hypothetical protein T484DRAFT_1620675 [Cryptophyta sp. CCMP2293]
MVWDFGCRVWGLGVGLGFRVQGSGCRVQGSEFRVQGSGFPRALLLEPLDLSCRETSGTIASGVCQALPRGFYWKAPGEVSKSSRHSGVAYF